MVASPVSGSDNDTPMTEQNRNAAATGGADAATATHAIPVFEGPASRRHRRVPFGTLRKTARDALTRHSGWGAAHTLVLFAGFPRSGHSVVGALTDAHPQAEIAHELDAVGLIEAGLPGEEDLALPGPDYLRETYEWLRRP